MTDDPIADGNERQKSMVDARHTVVVDAGPGTGKTKTIVDRYVKLIEDGISPEDILMLTFSRNAKQEMEQRIKTALNSKGLIGHSNSVQTMTFDSFCTSIVNEGSSQISTMFNVESKLGRSHQFVENETLNNQYFSSFMDDFLLRFGNRYGNQAIIASQNVLELKRIISKLISKGIVPRPDGWFGLNKEKILYGDREQMMSRLQYWNGEHKTKDKHPTLRSVIDDAQPDKKHYGDYGELPIIEKKVPLKQEILETVCNDPEVDATVDFIHDVYFEYIRKSINDNRLTYEINALFAFLLLYNDDDLRGKKRYEYVMIDEFQDTNTNQLAIALMVSKNDDLCVVGDWKQSIYAFRNTSPENILFFEQRSRELRAFLGDRVPGKQPTPTMIEFVTNFRSSKKIIDKAFESMTLPGGIWEERDTPVPVPLLKGRLELDEVRHSEIIFSRADATYRNEPMDESDVVLSTIRYLIGESKQVISVNKETKEVESRDITYGDIAVLCRSNRGCRAMEKKLRESGIPAFIDGDVSVMATREGKLILAWMRFVNNMSDTRGFVPIMADMGYSQAEIDRVVKNRKMPRESSLIPEPLLKNRDELLTKTRRITDFVSSVFRYYNIDNDISQSITHIISDAHGNSLMTVADIIRMVDTDIVKDTTYPLELSLGKDAVTVMTIHKAKGLEFPAVIVPYVDFMVMPNDKTDSSVYYYHKLCGIRCTKQVCDFGDYRKIVDSWKTDMCKIVIEKNYDEDRNLMFVALSRAKQYECVITGSTQKTSRWFNELRGNETEEIKDGDIPPEKMGSSTETTDKSKRPIVGSYPTTMRRLAVHDIMKLDGINFVHSDGKKDQYVDPEENRAEMIRRGTEIHIDAERMFQGYQPLHDNPENKVVKDIINSRKDADLLLAEKEVLLPIMENTVLKGVVDLMAIYPDRVEIHDYKTDSIINPDARYEYMLQLSVYAHAAQGYFKGKTVKCYIQYVSLNECVEFEPISIDVIRGRTEEYIRELGKELGKSK